MKIFYYSFIPFQYVQQQTHQASFIILHKVSEGMCIHLPLEKCCYINEQQTVTV